MPGPSASSMHVNAILTDALQLIMQDEEKYVSHRVCTVTPSDKKSDTYFVHTPAEWYADEAEQWSPGGGSPPRGGYTVSTDTFTCQRWVHGFDITDEMAANSRNEYPLEESALKYISGKLLIRDDRRFATAFMAQSVWGTDVEGVAAGPAGTQFVQHNSSSSTPLSDILGWMLDVETLTGFLPNRLITSPHAYKAHRVHADFKTAQQYQGIKLLNGEGLASILELDSYAVCRAVYNTAARGLAASMSYIVPKAILLAYMPQTPSPMDPTAGRLFAWTGMPGTNEFGVRVRDYEVEDEAVERRIVGEIFSDFKVTAASLGLFARTAVA